MFVPMPGLELALQRWWSRWVMRGRKPDARFLDSEAGWVLTYTLRYRLTAVVTFAAFTTLYVFAYREGGLFVATAKGIFLTLGSIVVWLLFGSFFMASQIERVVITPTELRRRSWRGRQSLVLGEVRDVQVREENGDLRIRAATGLVIEVSLYLDGLAALAGVLPGRVERYL